MVVSAQSVLRRLDAAEEVKEITTAISLSQAQEIYDNKATGMGTAYDDVCERDVPAVVLISGRRDRGGFGILGWTDTETFTLTTAGSLVVSEIVRLGKAEGIEIVPGAHFKSAGNKKAKNEPFVPLRRGHAVFKHSADYYMPGSLAFMCSYSEISAHSF